MTNRKPVALVDNGLQAIMNTELLRLYELVKEPPSKEVQQWAMKQIAQIHAVMFHPPLFIPDNSGVKL